MKYSSKVSQYIPLMLLIVVMVAVVGGVAAQDGMKVLVSGRQMGASDIPTLDPSISQDVVSVQVEWELFPGLARFNEETSAIQPGMSTWDVSGDGLVYTFHILENIPWVRYNADSGEVEQVMDDSGNVRYVTAQDFANGIQRSLDPDTASPYLYVVQPWIAGAYDFEADNSDPSVLGLNVVDDNTLEVTVTAASSVTPAIFDMWVTYAVPQWLIDEYAEFWIDPENIATFGPFALKEWVRGDGGSLTMVKNPFWPGTDSIPQPKLDEVQFVFLDPEPQLANFEAGTLGVAEVPNSAIDRILADATLSADYFTGPGTCTYYYGFNTLNPPFDDARVRRAFSMAIDRQAIVENVTKAGESPAGFFALPSLNAAPAQADYPGLGIMSDPEAAQSLWQEYLDETGTQASDYTPTLLHNTSSLHASIAQAVQQMWSETLGVNVQITVQDFATYLDSRGTTDDIYRAGWCFDYPDAHNFYYDAGFHSDLLEENDTHWSNADYDSFVDQAFAAPTVQERRDFYAQADDILVNKDAAIAPIYFYVTKDLTQPGVVRTHSLITREAYEKWDING